MKLANETDTLAFKLNPSTGIVTEDYYLSTDGNSKITHENAELVDIAFFPPRLLAVAVADYSPLGTIHCIQFLLTDTSEYLKEDIQLDDPIVSLTAVSESQFFVTVSYRQGVKSCGILGYRIKYDWVDNEKFTKFKVFRTHEYFLNATLIIGLETLLLNPNNLFLSLPPTNPTIVKLGTSMESQVLKYHMKENLLIPPQSSSCVSKAYNDTFYVTMERNRSNCICQVNFVDDKLIKMFKTFSSVKAMDTILIEGLGENEDREYIITTSFDDSNHIFIYKSDLHERPPLRLKIPGKTCKATSILCVGRFCFFGLFDSHSCQSSVLSFYVGAGLDNMTSFFGADFNPNFKSIVVSDTRKNDVEIVSSSPTDVVSLVCTKKGRSITLYVGMEDGQMKKCNLDRYCYHQVLSKFLRKPGLIIKHPSALLIVGLVDQDRGKKSFGIFKSLLQKTSRQSILKLGMLHCNEIKYPVNSDLVCQMLHRNGESDYIATMRYLMENSKYITV